MVIPMRPITPISNYNTRHLICFIDDFSRKAWMNFLVDKAKASDAFMYISTKSKKK
jgi:hypothetical protein